MEEFESVELEKNEFENQGKSELRTFLLFYVAANFVLMKIIQEFSVELLSTVGKQWTETFIEKN